MSAPLTPEVHIIGAGLLGTSIGLKLRSLGTTVSFEDVSSQNAALAMDLVGSESLVTEPHIVIVAVSPENAGEVVADGLKRYPKSIVVDVTSIKTKVIAQVRTLSAEQDRFIPTHPVAGREVGGPASAQGDLFEGRVWIMTPLPENRGADVQAVEDLILSLGATPHRMDPTTHDQLFARISHFPQILSTLLAGSLLKVEGGVELSGQGLRDMTRLAESDSKLWSQIISLNSEPLLRSIAEFKSLLIELEVALSKMDHESIAEIFRKGQEGRKLISGKHGGKPRNYMLFHIVIDDRPGVLGELFALCGEAGVNVEDLDLEHSPNQETGLITIAIAPEQDEIFASALKDRGWRFHRSGGLV